MLEPAVILALLGLVGGGVAALWKMAMTLGRNEGRTQAILETVNKMLASHDAQLDAHEVRLADLERHLP